MKNKLTIKHIKAAFVTLLLSVSINSNATTMVDLPQWQQIQVDSKLSFRGSAIIGDSLWITGSNNSVFVSQDGGKTWQDKSVKSAVTTDFRDIELFDKNTAIVMGAGNGAQSVLYKTTDGGNSWSLLYQNIDEKGFFDSIAFWDSNNGILLGDPIDGYYVIELTQDGGKTWQRVPQKNVPVMLDKEAAFAASGNTLIVSKRGKAKQGKAWLTTGGFSASVYASNDHGQTWQRHTVPLYNETQTAGGYGLALNHKQQLFVLGGDYRQRTAKHVNMATYTNGKWQVVNAGERGHRTAMSCEGNICLATGKTSSDISYNGGKSWQVVNNKHSAKDDQGFYTLASDNMVFLAAGAEGKIAVMSFKKAAAVTKDAGSYLKK